QLFSLGSNGERNEMISAKRFSYKNHLRKWRSLPESRKSEAKRMYVNLKYKMGNESLNAYFATWREDGWMMIELFQFLNHKKDTDFE
ncbi:hypothetical protein M8C21_027229, partial [Ambrosia artemisiifolia]